MDVITQADRAAEWWALRDWVAEQTDIDVESSLGGEISTVERRAAISWTLARHWKESVNNAD